MSEVKLHVETEDAFWERARAVATRLDRGEAVEPVHELSFGRLDLLLQTLTAERWRILRALKRLGPASLATLASALGMAEARLGLELAAMIDVGLVAEEKVGSYSVPWSRITADMDLEQAA